MNRRGFLKVGAAGTGGLLVGFYLPEGAHATPWSCQRGVSQTCRFVGKCVGRARLDPHRWHLGTVDGTLKQGGT